MAGHIENRGGQLQGVAITLVITAVIAFSLRVYVRLCVVKAFGLDDYFMAVAAVCFILYCTCVIIGVHYGTGRHFADLSLKDRNKAMQYWLLCYVWYSWTMITSKISIGVFLLRITIQKIHILAIYIAMGLTVVTGLVFFFVSLFQCIPVSFFWDKSVLNGSCITIDVVIALGFLYSALNIICDFTFALLPILIVKGLNMKKTVKIVIVPLLGMGCIASSACVVRLAYIERFRDPDFLWATLDIAIWSTIEAGLAITAGSLACLRPLCRKLGHVSGWTSSHATPSTSNVPGLTGPGPKQEGSRRSRGPRDMFSLSTFATRHEEEDMNDDNDWVSRTSTRKLILHKGATHPQLEEIGARGSSGDDVGGHYSKEVVRSSADSPL